MADKSPKALFGLSRQRLRGMMVLALAFLLIYLILFERDPPPSFREVAVEIPSQPEIDHQQREFEVAQPQPPVAGDEDAAAAGDSPIIAAAPAQPSVAPRIEAAEAAGDDPPAAAEEQSGQQPEEAASTPAGNPEPEAAFRIQLVALSDREKAEDFARRLGKLLETQVNTDTIEREGLTLHRAWLGPFASKEEAEQALAELRAADRGNEFESADARIIRF